MERLPFQSVNKRKFWCLSISLSTPWNKNWVQHSCKIGWRDISKIIQEVCQLWLNYLWVRRLWVQIQIQLQTTKVQSASWLHTVLRVCCTTGGVSFGRDTALLSLSDNIKKNVIWTSLHPSEITVFKWVTALLTSKIPQAVPQGQAQLTSTPVLRVLRWLKVQHRIHWHPGMGLQCLGCCAQLSLCSHRRWSFAVLMGSQSWKPVHTLTLWPLVKERLRMSVKRFFKFCWHWGRGC